MHNRIIIPEHKPFYDKFKSLCDTRSSWQVWADFINVSAIAIRNRFETAYFDELEAQYLSIVKGYSKEELQILVELFAFVEMSLMGNPSQDLLGDLYMELDMNSHWHGQFFTPYHIAQMIAMMTIGGQESSDKPITITDPACGSGVLLIAAADAYKKNKTTKNLDLFFIGQDIDPIVAKMCYIQLSILGCCGYVKIGNSLTDPIDPSEDVFKPRPSIDIWPTPMLFLLR